MTATRAWHDLYRLKDPLPARHAAAQDTDRVVAWIFDNKEQLRLAARAPTTATRIILRVDPTNSPKSTRATSFESCRSSSFDKDNKRVYLETKRATNI